MEPFIPYNGGKNNQYHVWAPPLREALKRGGREYREPFLGGGAVALGLLRPGQRAWLNDANAGQACLWNAVLKWPDELLRLMALYSPSQGQLTGFQAELKEATKCRPEFLFSHFGREAKRYILCLALAKMACLCWAWHGVPGRRVKAAGKGWSLAHRSPLVMGAHRLLKSLKLREDMITCRDFSELLEDESPAVIFLDPPFFCHGGRYQADYLGRTWKKADHERLAVALRGSRHRWFLSYDDRKEVHQLYHWAHVEVMEVQYGQISSKDFKEVIICPKRLKRMLDREAERI
jgi:DNA adenine methylase